MDTSCLGPEPTPHLGKPLELRCHKHGALDTAHRSYTAAVTAPPVYLLKSDRAAVILHIDMI